MTIKANGMATSHVRRSQAGSGSGLGPAHTPNRSHGRLHRAFLAALIHQEVSNEPGAGSVDRTTAFSAGGVVRKAQIISSQSYRDFNGMAVWLERNLPESFQNLPKRLKRLPESLGYQSSSWAMR